MSHAFKQTSQANWGVDDLQMIEAVNILKDMVIHQTRFQTNRAKVIALNHSTFYLIVSYSFISFGQIAQSVEQRTENPCVAGSIPVLAIFSKKIWPEKKPPAWLLSGCEDTKKVRWTFFVAEQVSGANRPEGRSEDRCFCVSKNRPQPDPT